MLDNLTELSGVDSKLQRAAKKFSVRSFAGHIAHASQLDHLRIAHLTDLHVGRVTPMKTQLAAIEIANQGQPDLVAITGDFVCHSQLYLDELSEVIQGIHAPVVCVMGNHDYWAGAKEVRRALRGAGALVLDNQWSTLSLRGQTLQVVGVDDAYTGHADIERAVKGLKNGVPTVGLSHIAEEADALWEHDVPLVLSGHTHAGQITVAKLHEIALGKVAGHRYVHGMYGDRRAARQKGAVYVGAGVGASVMPLRIGERGRREVAFFELGYDLGQLHEHHAEQPALPGRAPSGRKRYRRAAQVIEKARRREAKKRG